MGRLQGGTDRTTATDLMQNAPTLTIDKTVRQLSAKHRSVARRTLELAWKSKKTVEDEAGEFRYWANWRKGHYWYCTVRVIATVLSVEETANGVYNPNEGKK